MRFNSSLDASSLDKFLFLINFRFPPFGALPLVPSLIRGGNPLAPYPSATNTLTGYLDL